MIDVFEYRLAPNKWPVKLALLALVGLLLATVLYQATDLILLTWVVALVTLTWMTLMRPSCGIRIDDNHLILGAWRNPEPIALHEIDHMTVAAPGVQTLATITYRDGRQQQPFGVDLPEANVLVQALKARGVQVFAPA